MSQIQAVADAVAAGKTKLVGGLVQEALDGGCAAVDILNAMIDAMGVVGERFKNNEIFVPEMLIAAKAMKKGVEILKPHLASGSANKYGKLIIGTVAGDLHDIGKNLVAMMIESAGFEVIDLGVDVPASRFIDTVHENPDTKIVALSALNDADFRDGIKIMVGGAPISQAFADEIGADAYTPDAASAAQKAKELAS